MPPTCTPFCRARTKLSMRFCCTWLAVSRSSGLVWRAVNRKSSSRRGLAGAGVTVGSGVSVARAGSWAWPGPASSPSARPPKAALRTKNKRRADNREGGTRKAVVQSCVANLKQIRYATPEMSEHLSAYAHLYRKSSKLEASFGLKSTCCTRSAEKPGPVGASFRTSRP